MSYFPSEPQGDYLNDVIYADKAFPSKHKNLNLHLDLFLCRKYKLNSEIHTFSGINGRSVMIRNNLNEWKIFKSLDLEK